MRTSADHSNAKSDTLSDLPAADLKSDNVSDLPTALVPARVSGTGTVKSDNVSDLTVPAHLHTWIAERLPQALASLDAATPDELIAAAAQGLQMELVGRLQAGLALRRLKAAVPHGSYLGALAERGIHERTARRCVDLAALALRTPAGAWQALANLSASKLALLQDWSGEELEQLAGGAPVHGITLDQARALPAPELRDTLNEHAEAARALRVELQRRERDLAETRADLEIALHSAEVLRERLHGRPLSRLPNSVVRARMEGGAVAEAALGALDDLAVLIEELAAATDLDADPLKAAAQRGAAAANLVLNLRAVAARAEQLVQRMHGVFGEDDLPASPAATPPLDPEEIERILAAREALLTTRRADAAGREAARLERGQTRRGRGRPVEGKA